ncbi:MAG: squalene/phytoene synthase family protein [Pseudomonadota bacterium]
MSKTIQNLAETLRTHDADRFFAVMSAPARHRATLFTVYAFNLEIARIPYLTVEPLIAEMRLQFWRDVVEEAYQGKIRAHEVADPFGQLLQGSSIAKEDCMRLIDARRWDIHEKRFSDPEAFENYIENTAGALARIAAAAIGADDLQRSRACVSAIGGGVARWLTSYNDLKVHRIEPLPGESDQSIRTVAKMGLRHIQTVGRVKKPACYALRADWMATQILKSAIRNPKRVFEGRLETSDAVKKLRLLIAR